MVNTAIFRTYFGKLLPGANVRNRAGAPAYRLTPREALAQYAVTGTFNGTYYADGAAQLEAVKALALEVEPDFLARLAIHAAEKGHMKDMPVVLLAILSGLESEIFARAFPRVVKSGKMLRGFVHVMRSGATGRKSLGTRPKKLVQAWLEQASVGQILRASVGNQPSLADVIRMVHPKPNSGERRALYAWIVGKPHDHAALPEVVKALEAFRRDPQGDAPDVPFQLLTSLPLEPSHWAAIARTASFQILRQNLVTFERHGVFKDEALTATLADRLASPADIRSGKVFPYQLMMAWKMVEGRVPNVLCEALEEAMERAIANIPTVAGTIVLCPDVSGSMRLPVTGFRPGATTAVRCIDVAALMSASFLQRNPGARILPFERAVVDVTVRRQDSVMTNAERLAAVGGGGTNCAAPLKLLADERAKVDLVVIISDNQSWVGAAPPGQPTPVLVQWSRIKRINPQARLVCLDIQPGETSQAQTREDILNIGGFSDSVYEIIADFAANRNGSDAWVKMIEAMPL
nr:RNA-binding protein [uncultured Gellertiella sp.]